MIDELPEDQRELLLERLGEELIEEIAAEAKSVTSFYNLCIRAVGSPRTVKSRRIPTPMSAWDEIYGKRRESEPEFSHPMIAKVVKHFGGWSRMWLDFSKKREEKARNTFIMKFKDAIGG
ncbi:hypothetical protein LCGC14_0573050 [marine sediment metagenome]|uniref:Uncharacterized protein n=1 Tax=marine sediment metagenome TaxID=412755 RepID=A0A0F9RNW0_9ZZZZ